MHNGHLLAAVAAQAQDQPQQPMLNIAQPLNDTQFLALVAATLYKGEDDETPEGLITQAVEIAAGAFVAVSSGRLAGRIKALSDAAKKAAREQLERG